MRGSFIAQLLLGLVVGLACSRDLLDKDIEAERICREHCEHWLGCGRQEASPSCFDSCMDNKGRGWKGECRSKREEYYECLHGLSCENLALDQDAYAPEEQRLCDDQRYEYSYCSSVQDN